ncbi:D-aminoacylase [Adhaeretor mobilis]|uniref:D-aminoacylase n=2 Tax=Adhaeretor mobilis TaxID=1930276 RepID=A0A517N261_9BACT|nr:D-aminoacylase [Adhaeretor mobilis]
MPFRFSIAVAFLLACSLFPTALAAENTDQPISADFVLQDGTIVDGTGGEPYQGSVAVRDDKIIAVGKFTPGEVKRTIDCRGLVICPGFIDLHNHSDSTILTPETRDSRCYLTQGCTTLVTGNCGGGPIEVGKYYDELAAQGIGVNVAHLLPQGSLRGEVIGQTRRAPNDTELQKMQSLADTAMQEGAWGMSTGLQYVPGSYADTAELVAIASRIAKQGGFYASHMRDESDELLEAVEETIEIGRQANLPVHVSHFKSSKRRNWGKVRAAAHVIEEARKNGVRVTADQYPYTASSTSIMAMLLSDKEREGGNQATAERLKNPTEAARLRPYVAEALAARDRVMIASSKQQPDWVGMLIREVAAAEKREPIDIAMEILLDASAQGVNFSMDEGDVRYVMMLPWVATASDGSVKIDDGSRPHPRSFGTFPRKIGRYAIQDKVLPLAAAIRSASGLPADILGMTDRGYVRTDQVADLVVFDPVELQDNATYQEPFQPSQGVRWVLVNGKLAIDNGELLETLAGKPLRRDSGGE